jgi:hypothetical protein
MYDAKTVYSLSFQRGDRREHLQLAVGIETASLLLYTEVPGLGRVWGLNPDAVVGSAVALLSANGASDIVVRRTHDQLCYA